MIHDHKDFYRIEDLETLAQAREIKRNAHEWIDRFEAAESALSKKGYNVDVEKRYATGGFHGRFLGYQIAVTKSTPGVPSLVDDYLIEDLIEITSSDSPDPVVSALCIYANTANSSFEVVKILESLIATESIPA